MIDKRIHYYWFGKGKYPPLVEISLMTWKQKLNNYELILHDDSNYNVDEDPDWVKEAYNNKLYAFVADYARAKILYNEGGIYLDTDCFVNKENCLDKYLNYSFFMPVENVLHDDNIEEYNSKVNEQGCNLTDDYIYGIDLNPIVFGC